MDNGKYPPGSRFVAYLRDSGGSEQELSVLQQEAEFRSWAKQHGYTITQVFTDAARPGSTTAGRQAFEEMINYLRKEAQDELGVVIWKYSRFSRDLDDSQFFKADLRRRGFEIISLQEDIPEGPEGRLLESIIDWMNQRMLADLSSDVKRGKRYMVTVHKAWPGGRPPVGYQLQQDHAGKHRDGSPRQISRLTPDPDTAPLVRRAFELRAEGASFAEILAQIPIAGSVPSLGRVMRNRVYTGDFEYAGTLIRDYCPPVVGQELWQAAQKVNKARRERHGYDHPRRLRSRFILTGILRCGRCGKGMHGRVITNKNSSRFDYYRCQTQTTGTAHCGAQLIPKDEIEQLVLARLRDRILQPEVLEQLRRRAQDLDPGDSDLERMHTALQAQLEDHKKRINRIVDAIEAGGHLVQRGDRAGSPALLKKLADLEEKAEQIQQKAVQCELEIAERDKQDLDGLDLEQIAAGARLALADGTVQEKTTILRAFVLRVRAEKQGDDLTGGIEYRLPGVDVAGLVPL